MKITTNCLDGCYAAPKDHPVTCANPAPWKILECKIEPGNPYNRNAPRVFVRGQDSMWFLASNCHIDEDLQEVQAWMDIAKNKPVGYQSMVDAIRKHLLSECSVAAVVNTVVELIVDMYVTVEEEDKYIFDLDKEVPGADLVDSVVQTLTSHGINIHDFCSPVG